MFALILITFYILTAEKQGHHKVMASTHWKIERVLAVSMLGILPACLFVQGPVVDFLLSTSVLMHGFWYVLVFRPRKINSVFSLCP